MSSPTDIYVSLVERRSDLRFFFNRTKNLWTIQVMSRDEPETVTETFSAQSLEVLQPSYTVSESRGMLQAFGVIRKRRDKDEIQITSI